MFLKHGKKTLDRSVALHGFVDARVVGMEVDEPAANDRRHGRAVHLPPVKRRVAAFRFGATHVEDPLEVGIEKRYVRVRVLFQRTTIGEAENPRRIRGAHLHDTFKID